MPAGETVSPIRRSALRAALCYATVALAGCDRQAPVRAAPPLRIAIDLWAGYYPLLLARELGYLKAAGIEVEISLPENTRRLLSDFSAGSYDGVCVSLGDVITLTRTSPDIRMVLASDESAGGDVLLAREPFADAAALRGKRIGTSLGGFGELLVLRYLARFGLSFDDVKLVNADASSVPELLKRGEVDVGHSWEPYVSMARNSGCKAVFSSADTPGLIVDGLIFRLGVIESRPDAVRAVVAAWFRALAWWDSHPAEGDQRLLVLLKGRTNDVSRDGIKLLGVAENRAKFRQGDTDSSIVHVADQYIQHFISRGYLIRRPEPASLIDLRMLP
ncbi:ABC transporter substrate-binding protein [Niveibacterium microcysteis]|uniref:ABC transporter substrate-binding protein n=1 Tax=Niveibacterium microcysteis TaxID=2811415 RepID=A0ABX7M7V6_9RHOO|nr:ABC transporter substrate-binding protein [Niveibacterium microcysteis]QSI76525.1 ABC transporter substrate-binding protein [Niveibacterium microcysteis]